MGKLVIKNLQAVQGNFILSIDSFEAPAGKITGLMGQSGSGKSTFLNVLSGFIPVKTGSIELNGVEICALRPERRKMSFMFQTATLFPHLNVFENVEFGLKVQGVHKNERTDRVKKWLKRLGIERLSDKHSNEVSGGEGQRVALARALIVEFPVLLLDEPFSALDQTLRKSVRDLVKELAEELNLIAILVSHDPEDVKALCERVYHLKDGKILGVGSAED